MVCCKEKIPNPIKLVDMVVRVTKWQGMLVIMVAMMSGIIVVTKIGIQIYIKILLN